MNYCLRQTGRDLGIKKWEKKRRIIYKIQNPTGSNQAKRGIMYIFIYINIYI